MEVKEPNARSIAGVSYSQDVERQLDSSDKQTQEIASSPAVEIEIRPEIGSNVSKIPELNRVINVVNVVADATNQISDLVDGIAGIAAQIEKGVTPQYEEALATEAKGLVDAIKKTAQVKTDGSQPLYGDPIRVELEQELGKTLDLIFPDVAKDALGLEKLALSPKDFILNTQAGLAEARKRLEELRQSVRDTVQAVRDTVNSYEVARQNSEASQFDIRDVDQALKLAFDTRNSIGTNPAVAMRSVGQFTGNALDLLK